MILSVSEAAKILQQGGIVAFPTETVYGLGADATNEQAINKVFQAKNRPKDNPLICHFYSIAQIQQFVPKIPHALNIIIQKLTPGPVSFLLPLLPNSPLLAATSGQPSVIVRIPNHPLALELIEKVNNPIAAPSANTSGRSSGTNPEMIEKDLGSVIDGIVDGGQSAVGLESTIVDCRSFFTNTADKPIITILRPGAIGRTELEGIIQKYHLSVHIIEPESPSSSITSNEVTTTPGAKYPHYSPQTPVYNWSAITKAHLSTPFVVFYVEEYKLSVESDLKNKFHQYSVSDGASEHLFKNIPFICLGSLDNIEEIARNLYKNLISLDQQNVAVSFFYPVVWPQSSLGKAIENRLSKVVRG